MSYTLRPAITTEAKPLIGLYSESGAGKTKSALLLAKGFAVDMSKVAMIETEAGRGEVYAKDPVVGGYLVRPIRDNFAPAEYGKALTDVEKAGMKVVIIDSASHEWEGASGVLMWAAKNQEDGKKGPLVWQLPKMSHQRDFILRLLQTPIPLVIICMRAKYCMKEVEKNGKKEWQRSEILEPKQADDILFEMMVHGWIDSSHNFHGTKYTTDDFKDIFTDNKPISIDTGRKLAAWAAGGEAPQQSSFITRDQGVEINNALKAGGIEPEKLFDRFGVKRLGELRADQVADVEQWISGSDQSEHVDESTGEVKDTCPECQQPIEGDACRNLSCPEGKPYDEP